MYRGKRAREKRDKGLIYGTEVIEGMRSIKNGEMRGQKPREKEDKEQRRKGRRVYIQGKEG